MWNLLPVFLISYLIGSIPTAFLLVKKNAQVDIRKSGSGNVGAFNSFRVTGSKKLAITIGVLDALKGVVAVFVASQILGEFSAIIVSVPAVVAGHVFPVWLKFQGGRGLATAAGAMLVVAPFYLLLWGIIWYAISKIGKGIIRANVIATVGTFIATLVIPGDVLLDLTRIKLPPTDLRLLGGLLTLVILSGHWNAWKEFINPPESEL